MPTVRDVLVTAGVRSRLMVEAKVGADSETGFVLAPELIQQGIDTNLFDGSWMVIDSADDDATFTGDDDQLEQRGIQPASFDDNQGRIAPLRAFSAVPVTDDRLLVAAGIPPYPSLGAGYSWLDAVNEGLGYCRAEQVTRLTEDDGWHSEFEIPDGTLPGPRSSWERLVSKAELHDTVLTWKNRQSLSHNGYDWTVDGGVLIVTPPIYLSDDQRLYITAHPPHKNNYAVAERTMEVAVEAERAILATLWRMFRRLNSTLGAGKYNGEELTAKQDFDMWEGDYTPRRSLRL